MATTLFALWASTCPAQGRLTSEVNPFIGTGGHGHTYPGPSLPFGMVQPGPDTRLTGWDGCSGYHYSDARIFGFSHTHLSGTGVADYADVLLMPTTGKVRFNNGADGTPGYSSSFSHAREEASPGYYAVSLDDHGVFAELTTTLRVGFHRYSFPRNRRAHVILDLAHRDRVTDAGLRIENGTDVVGWRHSTGWAADQRVFFVIRFSRPFTDAGLAIDDREQAGLRGARGTSVKARFDFGDAGGPLLVKVGLSFVDLEGARRNLEAELPGWNFEATRAAAADAWERELGRIRVSGGTRDQRAIFYTALYHAMLAPNVFMDADGRYRGRDGRPHVASGFTYYSVFSLWDTFRALHPLLAIIDRARTADFVQTMIRQFEEGGRLPVWELAGNETDTMIGYHAVPVIADAILKGIPGLDAQRAYRAMTHSAEEERFGLGSYKTQGYVAAEEASESVSRTLEYAFDDWCIAMVARHLGLGADADRYLRRAQSWKNLFDPSTGFMRARVDGFWFTPFDPFEVNAHYTEANAWQYSFFVPQDVDGLIAAHGGDDPFTRKLDALFAADTRISGTQQADITGLVGQYAHGNEPSHHVAYLYAYAGQAWKTQRTVRQLLDTMYANAPDGLAGNEDCGQMSAWYVLSALGFYPVRPAGGDYVVGAPLFPVATVSLEHGRRLVVRALGTSSSARYVTALEFDGKPHDRAWLTDAMIARGGELTFAMSDTPATAWAAGPDARPHSAITAPLVTPVPFVTSGRPLFRGTTEVTLGNLDPHASIRYTKDGSRPDATSPVFGAAIPVDGDSVVTAVAWRGDAAASHPLVARLHRIPDGLTLTLSARYRPQYNAGGDEALIDGRRGGADFRLGRWQGYLGTDLEATLDFGRPREIRRVAIGLLQAAGAWIPMPCEVQFALSDDGVSFRQVGTITNRVPADADGVVTRDVGVEFAPQRARYVRVRLVNSGPLPAGHAGAGEPSWFFADEIVVEP
jgi:predicted alpha-1,2-mannosidase